MRSLLKIVAAVAVILGAIGLRVYLAAPTMIAILLLNAGLTYLIAIILSPQLPAVRRFSASVLVLCGMTYSVPAMIGFDPAGGLVEQDLWGGLIRAFSVLL
jgi:hypothetical protein